MFSCLVVGGWLSPGGLFCPGGELGGARGEGALGTAQGCFCVALPLADAFSTRNGFSFAETGQRGNPVACILPPAPAHLRAGACFEGSSGPGIFFYFKKRVKRSRVGMEISVNWGKVFHSD